MKNKSLFLLLGALAFGILCGFFVSRLDGQTQENIAKYAVETPCNVFLTVLRYIAGPLIFLSLIDSIYGCGDLKTFGRIGKNAFLRFLLLSFLAGVVSVLFSVLFFGLTLSSRLSWQSEWQEVFALFRHFIPKNPWEPFLLCDLLQISFMAIVLGFLLLLFGKRAKAVFDILKKAENFFTFLIRIIGKVVPVYVFLSAVSLFLSGDADTLFHIWKLLLCFLCVSLLLLTFVFLRAFCVTKIPLRQLLTHCLPPFLIAVSTANSTMALEEHFKTAEEKFGVSETTSRFAVPLAMSIFKPSSIMYLSVIGCYFAAEMNLSISLSWIVTAAITTTLLTISIPPVPGGGINCYTVLFHQLGMFDSALSLALALNAFVEFPITGFNNLAQPPEILMLETKRKMRDEKTMRERNNV